MRFALVLLSAYSVGIFILADATGSAAAGFLATIGGGF